MNILFVASEGFPFSKTGGLADVIGSLPKALQLQGINVQVILPKYAQIPTSFKKKMKGIKTLTVPVGWRNQYCGIEKLEWEGTDVYFIDNEYYFNREHCYGYYDDGERFAFFSRAVLEALPYLNEMPDLLHCHDWQTGMISILMKVHFRNHPAYEQIKTVFTIHNLKYQGVFPKSVLHDLLNVSDQYFHMDGLEYYGNVSFMKAGLVYFDLLTTVSPTYAREIQQPYYGEGLDGLLRKYNPVLYGIVNGIDNQLYVPAYNEKKENKRLLQSMLGFEEGEGTPLVACISRLVEQKGMDLILHVLPELLRLNLQFVILGTGDARYETAFLQAAIDYPNRIFFNNHFDESFARQLYAASDVFLMPSRYEPCGISQLLAMKYGSLPIVRETGGLKDTVQPYNDLTNEGTGFSFKNYNAHEMLDTITRAIKLYEQNPIVWQEIVTNAMNTDYSWMASAKKYKALYESLVLQH